MRLGVCSRSKDVIEPVLKPQWWVNCQGMAKEACEAVRDGTLQILPREYEAVWFRCGPARTFWRVSAGFMRGLLGPGARGGEREVSKLHWPLSGARLFS